MIAVEYVSYFVEYILKDPFTQISGFLAMGTILLAYFQKDDYTVKKLMLLSTLFWGTHFYLLGVYSGLAAIIIFAIRIIFSIKFQKSKNAFLSIIILTIIAWYFTYDGILTLLPIITSLSWAYSFFYLEKVKLRLMMMFNSSTWLIYHIFIGSLSGIMNEAFTQVILITTVYRMIHIQWGSDFYVNKVKSVLWKRRRVDYDRFIFIHDRLQYYRNKAWNNFLNTIHFDLRTLLWKKKYPALHKIKN